MKGYSAENVFTWQHQSLLEKAAKLVASIEEPKPTTYRCHEVTRFVFNLLRPQALRILAAEAILVDGNFAGVDHSWIRLDRNTILDVYAVARLPICQLVDVGSPTLLRTLYIGAGEEFFGLVHGRKMVEPERTDIRDADVDTLIRAWQQKTHSVCEMINDVCWMCGSDE